MSNFNLINQIFPLPKNTYTPPTQPQQTQPQQTQTQKTQTRTPQPPPNRKSPAKNELTSLLDNETETHKAIIQKAESKYFVANELADESLCRIQAEFFPNDKKPTETQRAVQGDLLLIDDTSTQKALDLINQISSGTINNNNIGNPHYDPESKEKDHTSYHPLTIVCSSPRHKQELLIWLQAIVQKNYGTEESAIKASSAAQSHFVYARALIKNFLNREDSPFTLKNHPEEAKQFRYNILANINSVLDDKHDISDLIYNDADKNGTGKFLKQLNKHLIALRDTPYLLIKLQNLIRYSLGDLHTFSITPDAPSYIQERATQQASFVQAQTLIHNMYHDVSYKNNMEGCIEHLLKIAEISNKKNRESAIGHLQSNITNKKDLLTPQAEQTIYWKQQYEVILDHSHTALEDIVNHIRTMGSDLRGKLKNWVETGLKDGKPAKISDKANITNFFQTYLLHAIVYYSNNLMYYGLNKDQKSPISLTEIGDLQTCKLGMAEIPDKDTYQAEHETAQKLKALFENSTFKGIVDKLHYTINSVIDSEQFMISNTTQTGSYFNPNHNDKISQTNFDTKFYNALTGNLGVMDSIRRICVHPEGLGQDYARWLGSKIGGANYRTDTVSELQGQLKDMITKEYFGAGYNALTSGFVNAYHLPPIVKEDQPNKDTIVQLEDHKSEDGHW